MSKHFDYSQIEQATGTEKCTDILYFVPEDLENPEACNATNGYQQDSALHVYNMFTIPSKHVSEVKLRDIIEWFPLPGEYHFRF
mmetsp:Transcript_33082/g.50748  ORF Transcript_33082/g.50748 Transcript_33082/m.50748 type:complete len:84 (-) Transcript_33082:294-545(-)